MARREPAVGFIFVTMVLSVLGFGLLIPVLPELVKEFHGRDVAAGSHAYGLLVGAFAVLQFIGSPILGALSDRYGRRRVILIALGGASVDYVIMALAPGMGWLFVARMIAGFTAGILATTNAYVADVTRPERRAQSFGLLGAAFGIGFVLGPLLGGFLGHFNLRLPFWFAAGCAALNWLYGYFVLSESLRPEHRRPFTWRRANPVGAFAALKRHPRVRGLAQAYFVLMLSQAMMYATWVLCTAKRYDWNTAEVGISLGVSGVLSAVVQATLVKRVVARLGDARTVITGSAMTIVALVLYGLAGSGWMVYPIIVLSSLGGISGPALQSYLTKQVPPDEQGAVQGVFGALMSLANIPGPLIGTWSFGWAVRAGWDWPGLGIVFFEGAVLVGIALMFAVRTFRANTPAPTERPEASGAA